MTFDWVCVVFHIFIMLFDCFWYFLIAFVWFLWCSMLFDVLDGSWWILMVLDVFLMASLGLCAFWCVDACWWFLMVLIVFEGFLWFSMILMVLNCLWWCLVVFDALWLFLSGVEACVFKRFKLFEVFCSGLIVFCWFLMVFRLSLWVLIRFVWFFYVLSCFWWFLMAFDCFCVVLHSVLCFLAVWKFFDDFLWF